jgi:hypothetical protein
VAIRLDRVVRGLAEEIRVTTNGPQKPIAPNGRFFPPQPLPYNDGKRETPSFILYGHFPVSV